MRGEHLDDRALARAAVDVESTLEKGHLAGCAACRDQVEGLRADLARLGRRCREAAPRSYKNFISSGEALTASAWNWKPLWSPTAGAMAVAALLAAVWLGFRYETQPSVSMSQIHTPPLVETMENEPEVMGGFAGFLVAENSSGQEQVFISADDDDLESGAEGVILWPGVL